MKALKTLLILPILLVAAKTWAQQDPQFTQYADNYMYFNPAFAGNKEMLNITAIHREQWAGVDGRPRSTALSVHSPVKYESIGVGLTLVNDMHGPVRQTIVAGDFSYSLRFKNKTKLSFGVKATVNFLGFDRDKLYNAGNPISALQQAQNKINPNFGFGIAYHGKRFFAGVSSPKILQNSYDGTKINKEQRHYFITAGYDFKLNDKWNLRPSTQVKMTVGAPVSIDFSLAAIYNEKIWFGAMYRIDAAVAAFFQIEVFENFKLGLASDFGTQKLRNYNHGTFEVLLAYNINVLKQNRLKVRKF